MFICGTIVMYHNIDRMMPEKINGDEMKYIGKIKKQQAKGIFV